MQHCVSASLISSVARVFASAFWTALAVVRFRVFENRLSSRPQKGRRPVMFGRKMNRPQEQLQLKQEVLDADLDIFASQSSFDQNFHKAIRVSLNRTLT